MAYSVTWSEKGFYAKFSETLTFKDMTEANKSFFGDESATRAKFQIYDFSDIDDFVSEELDPNYFAITDKGSNSYIWKIKLALVAKGQLAELCREYIKKSEELDTSWSIKLFDNLAAAKEWVNS